MFQADIARENIMEGNSMERKMSGEGKIFQGLDRLEKIRKAEKAFVTEADAWVVETLDQAVLGMGRYYDGEKLIGLFNFSEYDKTAWINEEDGMYVDLISGERMEARGVNIPAFGFFYLKKEDNVE